MSGRIELLDPGAPGVDHTLVEALLASGEHRRVVAIGGAEDAGILDRMGFDVLARVPADASATGVSAWLVGRRIRRVLETLVDLDRVTIGVWSEPALSAVLYAGVPAGSIDAVICAAAGRAVVPPLASRLMGATPRTKIDVRPVGGAAGAALSRRGWRVGSIVDPRRFLLPIHQADEGRSVGDEKRLVVGLIASPPCLADVRLAAEAVATLCSAGCSSELVISSRARGAMQEARWLAAAGDAIEGGDVRLRIDDRIDRPGNLASEIDVVLATSPRHRDEVSSMLALRGWLASGVPAIVPDDPSIRGLVQDGVDARVVPPGDRNSVVRAMIRLAEDPDLRQEMRHAAAARHARRVRRSPSRPFDQASGSIAAKSRAASR